MFLLLAECDMKSLSNTDKNIYTCMLAHVYTHSLTYTSLYNYCYYFYALYGFCW